MGRLRRIDSELVRRKLASSRTQAATLIKAGVVFVDGEKVHKPARQIDPAQAVLVKNSKLLNYASRGSYKLAGVLRALGDHRPLIEDKRVLDAGASTGGFTDVLLREGAAQVVAVDVGYGQLRWELQQDPRVQVHDRTNIRYLTLEKIGEPVDLVVSDLSFISLTLVLEALSRCASPQAEMLLMVKPQFEIGKEKVPSSGVVKNPDHHYQAIMQVVEVGLKLGLKIKAVEASPLPGPSGNIEFFIYFSKLAGESEKMQVERIVGSAVERGPRLELARVESLLEEE